MKTTDPWLTNPDGTADPFAANIAWDMPDLPDPDEQLTTGDPVTAPVLEPEVVRTPAPEPPPTPPEEPDEPKVYNVEGGTISLEKEKGQWKLSITGDTGAPQVFWGKNKDELLVYGLGKAQLNATKKIREQNRELKLGRTQPKPQPPAPTPAPQPVVNRQLTAEEVFEYNTLNQTNPAAALDFLLQKTRGVTVDEILSTAKKAEARGSYATNILAAEAATKTFLQNNPDYYPDPEWSNYKAIIRWVSKFKLGESVKKDEEAQAHEKLVASGVWTTENLEEAFQDLAQDDLLVKAPKPTTPQPPSPVVVQQQEPAQPAPRPDSRIVRQETRPRAALGIRPADVTPVKPPAAEQAPSVEDLNELSDADIAKLLAGVRKEASKNRRS